MHENVLSSSHKEGIMAKRKMTGGFFKDKTQATHDIEEEESSDDVIEALAHASAKNAKFENSFQEKVKHK